MKTSRKVGAYLHVCSLRHLPPRRRGIKTLSDNDFDNNADKQFRGVDFFDDRMVVVEDKHTALKALEVIVDQGEGNVGVEDSHYSIFLDLYLNQGEWECYNVKKDVKTEHYPAGLLSNVRPATPLSLHFLLIVLSAAVSHV